MHDLKLGVLLWNQATDWPSYIDAVRRIDRLGYAHLWAWDHLYAIFGDPYQPIFEGWESLSASAMATEKLQVGLLVGANTFRNPGLVAKLASTLDHISGGRAILGLGGAWMEPEHTAHGIDFGSGFGQRLDWLDESVAACRDLLDGKSVTSAPGGHYQFDDLRHAPAAGPGPPADHDRRRRREEDPPDGREVRRPVERHGRARRRHPQGRASCKQHCEDVGRDPADIEFTLGVKVTIRDSEAEAVRVMEAALEHNRTPLAGSRATRRSGTGPRSSSRSGSRRTSSSASGP